MAPSRTASFALLAAETAARLPAEFATNALSSTYLSA
jgi:hypothetical protein